MTPAWAQRQEELLRDCIVSPDVFDSMVDRLRAFVVPYQHVLESEAGQCHGFVKLLKPRLSADAWVSHPRPTYLLGGPHRPCNLGPTFESFPHFLIA